VSKLTTWYSSPCSRRLDVSILSCSLLSLSSAQPWDSNCRCWKVCFEVGAILSLTIQENPANRKEWCFQAGDWSKWRWSVLSICRGMNICTYIRCWRWVHDPYLMWIELQRWARWCDNSSFGIAGKKLSVEVCKQGELSSNSNAARNS
jgi:hypothetical protein